MAERIVPKEIWLQWPGEDEHRDPEAITWAEDEVGDYDVKYVRVDIVAEKTAALQQAEALAERLKQEAQIHAQEARTANSTIAEIYQACSGATGERGNWNGAMPVIAALQQREERIRELELCDGQTRANMQASWKREEALKDRLGAAEEQLKAKDVTLRTVQELIRPPYSEADMLEAAREIREALKGEAK